MMGLGPIELIIIMVLCFILVALPIGVALGFGLVRRSNRTEGRVPCPYCAEMILPGAKVCRFCGRELA
jgi:hypothetical protein